MASTATYYVLPEVELAPDKLPTVQEVFSHMKYLKQVDGKNLKLSFYFNETAERIIELWTKWKIPIISKKTCLGRLTRWSKNYDSWRKGVPQKSISGRSMLCDHEFFKIFDIAKCPHTKESTDCSCHHSEKIPGALVFFYMDQCSGRVTSFENVMNLISDDELQTELPYENVFEVCSREIDEPCDHSPGDELFERYVPVDEATSSYHKSANSGYSSTSRFGRPYQPLNSLAESGAFTSPGESSITGSDDLKDINYRQPESGEEDEDSDGGSDSEFENADEEFEKSARNIIRSLELRHFSLALERFGVTNVAASHIATALLMDLKLISEHDTRMVIDQQKIKRSRDAMRRIVEKQWARESKLKSIFFDGKKGNSLVPESVPDVLGIGHSKQKPKYVVKPVENITILAQPGNNFLGFVTPPSGKGEEVCDAVSNYLNESNFDWHDIIAIGTDGASNNTGKDRGAIPQMEKLLGRPVHWIICLFHLNEKCLEWVLKTLGCNTTSGNTYTGVLGSLLMGAHTGKLNSRFRPVKLNNLPEIVPDYKLLTSDQKYLLEAAQAVSIGSPPGGFDRRSPGKLNNARWLTKANRILRLYMRTQNPSIELQNAVIYLQNVFIPTWFHIKMEPKFCHGSRHFFNIVKFTKSSSAGAVINAVEDCLTYNFYYAFSEQIIIAMVTDPDPDVRVIGFEHIKRIRNINGPLGDDPVREVKRQPKSFYNFDANSYYELIDLNGMNIFEPPSTMHLSDEDIDRLQSARLAPLLPNIPCHSQAVEFYVQEVNRVASLAKPERRVNIVRCTSLARRINPYFKTKKNCIVNNVDWNDLDKYMKWD